MKPKNEIIEQAIKRLEKVRSAAGKLLISQDELNDLNYIATGKRTIESPQESNRSFFHLQEIPCIAMIAGKKETGIFSHEGYAAHYQLKRADGSIAYFKGGEDSFTGSVDYVDWEPSVLRLYTNELPTSLELLVANPSLNCACL